VTVSVLADDTDRRNTAWPNTASLPAPSQGAALDIVAQDHTGASARKRIDLAVEDKPRRSCSGAERAGYRVGENRSKRKC